MGRRRRKNTKFFLSLDKSRQQNKAIEELEATKGNTTKDQTEILNIA